MYFDDDILRRYVNTDLLLKDVGLTSPHKDLSVAVIGFGKMGLLHSAILNLLNPGLVRYVVDKSPVVTFGGRLLMRDIKFIRSVGKLADSKEDIDAVYITTSTETHYLIAKELQEVGFKYIFIEKPPVRDLQQFEDLLNFSRGSSVMVGFQKRFSLPFRHAKLLLDRRVLGDLKRVKCSIRSGDIINLTDKYKRLGRGVLLDLGIHVLDLLSWFFGGEPLVKVAKYESIYSGLDDYFKAVLSLGGVEVDFEVTWSDPAYRLPETYFELSGSNGIMTVTDDLLKLSLTELHPDLMLDKLELYKPHYYREFPPVLVADPEYTVENMHFLSVLENRHKPITNLESCYKTMEMVEELYRAASYG